MPAQHNIESERELWDTYAAGIKGDVFDGGPVFRWTQYADHGPGPELLGTPTSALEVGCGTGRAMATLAAQGVKVTGVDLSPVMVEKASERWGPSGVQIHCAEVLDYLSGTDETWDAVYSVFGAVWFTDPLKLFPLIAARLNPGGLLAFFATPSHPRCLRPAGHVQGWLRGASALYVPLLLHAPHVGRSASAKRIRVGGSGCSRRPERGAHRDSDRYGQDSGGLTRSHELEPGRPGPRGSGRPGSVVEPGQPLMLTAPVSRWPTARRDQLASVLTVTVKSYQPWATVTALK